MLPSSVAAQAPQLSQPPASSLGPCPQALPALTSGLGCVHPPLTLHLLALTRHTKLSPASEPLHMLFPLSAGYPFPILPAGQLQVILWLNWRKPVSFHMWVSTDYLGFLRAWQE